MKLFVTNAQLDEIREKAYKSGWVAGQENGIELKPEFTQQFFSQIRKNPQTLVWEIPEESYQVLKQQVARS